MERVLSLLAERSVHGTFFTTGEMARRHSEVIARVVREGHELGCHGDQHRDFTTLTQEEADGEMIASLATLRAFAPVVSFRAPYLRFPSAYLPLLVAHGLWIDSSLARYKFGAAHRPGRSLPGLRRAPASLTSSVLRLPNALRAPWFALAPKPLVLFVHPWEAVDFRRSQLRWDCRFRTGEIAVARWHNAIVGLQRSGARFLPLRELVRVCA